MDAQNTDTLHFTILGCGPSAGVPELAFGWGACDPNNTKNRRKRCSLLVKRGATTILVDTGPDVHDQLLNAGVNWIDAVLYTHAHADHINGIDDLRSISSFWNRPIDVYIDAENSKEIVGTFPHCFKSTLKEHRIEPNRAFLVNGTGGPIHVTPIHQSHGNIQSFGFRFGDLAYSCDLNGIMPDSLPLMHDLDTWIVDAVQYDPHPAHFCLSDSLEWINKIRPHHAVLTNLHHSMDYDDLLSKLPLHVEPAYDGMRLTAKMTLREYINQSSQEML